MFVRVKTRKPGWCRITATPIAKGASAFAPITRAAASCYIRADLLTADATQATPEATNLGANRATHDYCSVQCLGGMIAIGKSPHEIVP